jgi:hypothetical protein
LSAQVQVQNLSLVPVSDISLLNSTLQTFASFAIVK